MITGDDRHVCIAIYFFSLTSKSDYMQQNITKKTRKFMDDGRFNKKVYKWALRVSNNNCRNWCFRVRKMFKESQIEHLFSGVDFSVANKGYVVASIQDSIHQKFLSKWSTDVNRDISQTRTGRNKLRTYKQFKQIYRTECY